MTDKPKDRHVQSESRMYRPGPNGRMHPPVIVTILDVDDGSLDAAIERTLQEKKLAQQRIADRKGMWRGLLFGVPVAIMLWILIFFVFGWRPFG